MKPCLVLSLTLAVSVSSAAAHAAGFIIEGPDAFPTEEGGVATFTVRMASAPTGNVVPVVTSLDTSEVKVLTPTLNTFTPANWSTPQKLRVQGVDDDLEDGDVGVWIKVSALSGQSGLALTQNLDDDWILTFQSDYLICSGPTTENIHKGSKVSYLYNRLLAQSQPDAPTFDPYNLVQDDRVFVENSDGIYRELRTLHVVLRSTFTRQLTDAEVAGLMRSYSRAAHDIHSTSRGMLELRFSQVVAEANFDVDSFQLVYNPDVLFGEKARFVDYDKLAEVLAAAGHDVDDYDIISVSIPFQDSFPALIKDQVANVIQPPGGFDVPFTNAKTWNNNKTFTTLQYVPDPMSTGWAPILVHEIFHNVDYMHEYGTYPELRNPDSKWWLFTYDDLIVQDVFYALPKEHWFTIPSTWGTQKTRPMKHVIEMSCPEPDTYNERKVACLNGVTCDTAYCGGIPLSCKIACRCKL